MAQLPTPVYEEKVRLIHGDEESGFIAKLEVQRCESCRKTARKMKIFMALTIILSLFILGTGIFFFVHHGARNRHPGEVGMGFVPQTQEGNMVIYYNGPAFRLPGMIEDSGDQINTAAVSEGENEDEEEGSLPPRPHGSGAPPAGKPPGGPRPAGSHPSGSRPDGAAPPAGVPHGSGAPPAGAPPAGAPPAGAPPAGAPPAGAPPAGAPPADAPPAPPADLPAPPADVPAPPADVPAPPAEDPSTPPAEDPESASA